MQYVPTGVSYLLIKRHEAQTEAPAGKNPERAVLSEGSQTQRATGCHDSIHRKCPAKANPDTEGQRGPGLGAGLLLGW